MNYYFYNLRSKKDMGSSNTFVNIIMGIVILHFIVGFGWLFWKLNGPVKDKEDEVDKKDKD